MVELVWGASGLMGLAADKGRVPKCTSHCQTSAAVPNPQTGEVSFHTRLSQHSDPSPLRWASPQAPLTPDREARLGEGLPPFLTTKSSPAALVRSPPPTGHTRQPPSRLPPTSASLGECDRPIGASQIPHRPHLGSLRSHWHSHQAQRPQGQRDRVHNHLSKERLHCHQLSRKRSQGLPSRALGSVLALARELVSAGLALPRQRPRGHVA